MGKLKDKVERIDNELQHWKTESRTAMRSSETGYHAFISVKETLQALLDHLGLEMDIKRAVPYQVIMKKKQEG